MKCGDCGKETRAEESFRCRICFLWYCKDCSLKHFGLVQKGGRVYPKNLIKSIWWLIKKKFFGG